MKAKKRVIGHLEKCYALGTFFYDGAEHVAVAAETDNPCRTFDLEGNLRDTLWEAPGGAMTLCQVPGQEVLLSTERFYSPDNSAEAGIVWCRREAGEWRRGTLCALPFVHRFGVLRRGGAKYLIACTLKSAHAFPGDWTCPGRVWGAPLPEDVTAYSGEKQLPLTPLLSGLTKNHGFQICQGEGFTFAVAACENGVYKVVPPEAPGEEWTSEKLLDAPASDALCLDFDGDGERELLTLSPFHGDELAVWKLGPEGPRQVYRHPERLPFLHAIWGAEIRGRTWAFIGNREGDRDLIALRWEGPERGYAFDLLDRGAGAANVLHVRSGERELLFAANRETDEIAMYELEM